MTESQVIAKVKKFVDRHPNQSDAAKVLGISRQYLSDILLGRRRPSDSVLAAIKVERVETYRKRRLALETAR